MKNILIAAALLVVSTSASANLIVNGSFEDPGVDSGDFESFTSIPGWTAVSPGKIEVRNNRVGTASEGDNYVELDSTMNSAMTQNISTTEGTLYTLMFDYSPRIGIASNSNGISAYWNGTLLGNVTGTGGTENSWITYTFSNLAGINGLSVLKFEATGISNSFGGNIDDVRLNAVPVPAAAWLFGSALGLFGFARRRSI